MACPENYSDSYFVRADDTDSALTPEGNPNAAPPNPEPRTPNPERFPGQNLKLCRA
jgi:hypothetical protein